MPFEELKDHTENIQGQAENYIESTLAYYKLKGFQMAMKSMTAVVKLGLIVLFMMMVLLFVSIAGAFVIGESLDSYALGFLIVGGFYLLITLILFTIKDKIVEGPILEKFSGIFFND